MKTTKTFTRPELRQLRQRLAEEPDSIAGSVDIIQALLDQAEYGLDCAALLEEAVRFPAEPYTDAEALVARLTDGFNAIWNRHHWSAA
ncbi:MAG TPA: hypothetical protein VGK20_04540 [Candidatus Binatia bacterium]|jgi:hypothetical protein